MAAACNLLVSTSAFHATCCSAKGLLEDVTLGDRNLHANYSYGSVWKEDRVGNFQDLVITKSYGFWTDKGNNRKLRVNMVNI